MSTTAMTATAIGEDQWLQVPATWGAYFRLQRARGDRAKPRYTFVHGRLTIVSPSRTHDYLKRRLGGMLEDILIGLSIPYVPCGSTTLLKTTRPRTGIEPDEGYHLTNLEALLGKEDLVMGVDAPPDLVIEVVISHPVNDALEVYRLLGVREVWVCGRSDVVFLVLGEDGRYSESPTSHWLPFLTPDDLTPWVYREDLPNETVVRRSIRRWVSDVLAPRLPDQDQGRG